MTGRAAPSTEDIEQPHNLRLWSGHECPPARNLPCRDAQRDDHGRRLVPRHFAARRQQGHARDRAEPGLQAAAPHQGPPLSDAGGAAPAARRRPHHERAVGLRAPDRRGEDRRRRAGARGRLVVERNGPAARGRGHVPEGQSGRPYLVASAAGARRRRSRCRRRGGFRPDAVAGAASRPDGADAGRGGDGVHRAARPSAARARDDHAERSRPAPADLVRPRDAFRPVARPGVRKCRRAPADRPAGDHEPRRRLLRAARPRRGAGRQFRAQHRPGRSRLAARSRPLSCCRSR